MSGSFFCPRCQARITSQGGSHATCPGCGLLVDLALADTHAGAPAFVPIRDLSGEWLGPYQLESYLGSGGMGTVYRAKTAAGDLVALKLLSPQLAAQPDLVQRFHREARALAELTHPNIVALREAGTAGDQHYIAMELLAGESLEAWLDHHQPTLDQTLRIVAQIATALGAAHAKGIVHRDLKPANVIVDGEQLKVLDFGIAHVAIDDLTLTRSDSILGTVNYMAPEQRTKAKTTDHRADLFALGVIFYRLLTGQIPIGTFEAPSRLNATVPRRVDEVVTRLLQRDPDKRYADTQTLLRELSRLQRPAPAVRPAVVVAAGVMLAVGGTTLWLGGDPTAQQAQALPTTKGETVEQAVAEPQLLEPTALNTAQASGPPVAIANTTGGTTANEARLTNRVGNTARTSRGLDTGTSGDASVRPAAGKPATTLARAVLRDEPSGKSVAIGKLPAGEAVRITKTGKGNDGRAWAQVATASGDSGWLPMADLSLDSKKPAPKRNTGKKATLVVEPPAGSGAAQPQGALVGEKTAQEEPPPPPAKKEPATEPLANPAPRQQKKINKGGKINLSGSSLEAKAD